MTSGPDPGELPGFCSSMVFRYAPILRKGSGNNKVEQEQETKIHATFSVLYLLNVVGSSGICALLCFFVYIAGMVL